MKKFLVIIADGMSGWPLKDYHNQTSMELAKTPNMDFLAKHGKLGLVKNVPDTLPAGSDVANLAIFGYDPEKYYTGRAAIEAISQNINLEPADIIFRANLVQIENNKMIDFTAKHIDSKVAKEIMDLLNKKLGNKYIAIRFINGVSYRNLLLIKNQKVKLKTTPPHDITGQQIDNYLPVGEGSELIRKIMNDAEKVIKEDYLPQHRECKANMVWLWGEGKKMKLPGFKKRYGLSGAVISAVDLIKGIGFAVGMDYVQVPGITGFIDTNFKGKAIYALKALEDHDIVFIHIEAADEAGHMGDLPLKIKAIEKIDEEVLGTILKLYSKKDLAILLLPDHNTPIELKTHGRDPVPFLIYHSDNVENVTQQRFTEKDAQASNWTVEKGSDLLDIFLKD
ncbi:MAG: cofactor-independent phosphoglycerate mutase [Candidatus Margulisbacteria bacterium]|nr:cofactor-independent phosphoglycerate mutase [Candidatus Margulisiibacteriota bacterium]